jgi:hypothetical protein
MHARRHCAAAPYGGSLRSLAQGGGRKIRGWRWVAKSTVWTRMDRAAAALTAACRIYLARRIIFTPRAAEK